MEWSEEEEFEWGEEEEEEEFEFEEEADESEGEFEEEFKEEDGEEFEGEFEEEEGGGEFEEEDGGGGEEEEEELEEEFEEEVEEEEFEGEFEEEGDFEEEEEFEEEEFEGEFEEEGDFEEEEEFEEEEFEGEFEEEGDFEEEEEFGETFPVSAAKYAKGLQPQEVIKASTITSQMSNKVASSSSDTNQKTSMSPDSIQIRTEPNESSVTFCEMCVENKEGEQMFSIDGCTHSFCTDCISKHVAARIQDGMSNVKCPALNCKSVLELETCRPILPKGVLDLWEETLCNSLIASSSSQTNQETAMGPDSIQIRTEHSESSLTVCEICVEKKEGEHMFSIDGCVHSFCTDCISKHVAAKIQDGISNVKCLGLNCKSVLELETCRPILPKGVLNLWEETLCNSLIASSQKCYCPFNDCSAVLLKDNKNVIRESECPFCHRLFCAQCNVPWHSGVECEEYQRLNEDEKGKADLMVRELAKEKKWSRCPQCKFYVERTQGCPHIICRCQFQFCYGCDSEWTDSHGGCQRD